jgi:hypothetical protein
VTAAPALDATPRSDALLASYVGFTFLAWYLNGLGAVLPPLRDEVGDWAGIYTLLPGAVLFAWGIVTVTRARAVPSGREPGIALGFVVLTASIVVMGITGWPLISVIGAVVAAIAAGHINRVLPGMLAAALHGGKVEPVMMRANAFSSVAAIAAPLFVGASLAVGAGWLAGFVIPIAIAALIITRAARRTSPLEHTQVPVDLTPMAPMSSLPPFREWWRECAVLGVSIVVEFCFSYFAVTYLKEEIGLSKSAAAAGGAAWGVGMAIGRFLFSVRRPPSSVVPSVVTIFAGFVLFWGLHSPLTAIAGIGVAGLGASPLYPSRITILIERFPGAMHEGSKRAALAAGSALLVAPALMVSLRAVSDVRIAYLAVPALLVILLALATPPPRLSHAAGGL